MTIFYNYFLILLVLLFFSIKVTSQQCSNFQLYNESYPVCSGESLYLSSYYYNATGINNIDTSFQWSINGTLVSDSNNFDTVLVNNTNNTLDFTINFRGEAGSSCVFDSTFTITVYPKPSIETQVVNPSCPYVSGVTDWGYVNVSSNLSISLLNYANAPNGSFSSSNYHDSISSLQAGSYYVYLEGPSPLYCRSDTVTVDISNPPSFIQPTITHQNDNCGQGTGAIVINGLSGGTPPYTFTNSMNNSIYATPISDSVIIGLAGDST